jgi:Protein of unknown function (DUF1761)
VPNVSLVATVVATVLGFLLGGLWYGPLFGARWMALVGLSRDQARRDFNPVVAYGITFVLGFIASYVFGLYIGPNPGRAFAIVCGAAAGSCWVATSLATNYLFEGRPAALIAINAGYHAVRFTLIGVAFAFFG